MSSRAVAPQPEHMVSGCYGHNCGELFRALLAVAVASMRRTGIKLLIWWEKSLPGRGEADSKQGDALRRDKRLRDDASCKSPSAKHC